MDETRKYIRSQARGIMMLAVVCPFFFVSVIGAMAALDRKLERDARVCQEACVRW